MNPNTLLFSKLRDVKSPTRAHTTDAGIDFFLPNKFTAEDLTISSTVTKTNIYINDNGDIVIPPFGSVLLPSGVKCIIPTGHAMIFFNKSGVAAKKHLVLGSCLCDEGFRGEILFNLINTSSNEVIVSPGEKITQGAMLQVGYHVPCEVDDISNYAPPTDRGEGGFGSSGVQ